MMDNALEIACKHYNRAIDLEETIGHLEEIIEQFCMDAEAAPQRSLTNEQIDKVHQHAQGLRVTYDLFHREYARRIISEFLASGAAPKHECTRSHPHELMDEDCELRTELARLTNENARLKAEAKRFIKVEPWVLLTTQDLAKGIARRCFPDVPQFEVLDDLAGVISQIDNMTTGMERKAAPKGEQA